MGVYVLNPRSGGDWNWVFAQNGEDPIYGWDYYIQPPNGNNGGTGQTGYPSSSDDAYIYNTSAFLGGLDPSGHVDAAANLYLNQFASLEIKSGAELDVSVLVYNSDGDPTSPLGGTITVNGTLDIGMSANAEVINDGGLNVNGHLNLGQTDALFEGVGAVVLSHGGVIAGLINNVTLHNQTTIMGGDGFLVGMTILQTNGGIIEATTIDPIRLEGVIIRDGSLTSVNGGYFEVDSSFVVFDDGGTTPLTVTQGTTVRVNDLVSASATLTLKGTLHNAGTLLVQSTNGNTGTIAIDPAGATLDDSGALFLDAAHGAANLQGGLIVNEDNTIGGFGNISTNITNESSGSIQTNQAHPGVLNITSSSIINAGRIWTGGSSVVILNGTTVFQDFNGAHGYISATNANVELLSTAIKGGTLYSTSPYVIHVQNSQVVFDSTSTAGDVTVDSTATVLIDDLTSANSTLTLKGTLHNFGKVLLQPVNGNTNYINIDAGGAALDSHGALRLDSTHGGAILQGSGVLTNIDNTIGGAGSITVNIVNESQGAIQTTQVNPGILNITSQEIDNAGIIWTQGTSKIVFTGVILVQDVGGVFGDLSATNADVDLYSTTIAGGLLNSISPYVVHIQNSQDVFDSTTNAGIVTVSPNTTVLIDDDASANATLTLKGMLHNFGTLLVEPKNGNTSHLNIDTSGATLNSDGILALNATHGGSLLEGGTLTNVDNTIIGNGSITNKIVNETNGKIIASGGTMTINTAANVLDNSGAIIANNGLLITGATINNANGSITSDGATASISLRSSVIEGGAIATANGGLIEVDDSQVMFDSTAAAGAVTLTAGSAITVNDLVSASATLTLKGTLHNFGTLLVQPQNGNTSHLGIDTGGASLDSSGTVTLNASHGGAVIEGGTLTNVNNTISGSGTISNKVINEAAGKIIASGGTLTIGTGANVLDNSGTIVSNSTLLITGSTINNAGGTVTADGASATIHLQNSVIEGGSIGTANGGFIDILDAHVTLDSSTAAGAVTLAAGSTITVNDLTSASATLTLKGTLHNFGTLLVQPQNGNTSHLSIDAGGGALDSSGTVNLDSNHGGAVIEGGTLTNVNNTIKGSGSITNKIINQGVINASDDNAQMTINSGTPILQNTGTIKATGAAGLRIQSSTIDNTGGGKIIAGDGSRVDLLSSGIALGTLQSTGTGFFETLDALSVIAGAAIAAAITVKSNTGLNIGGVADNTGTITVDGTSGTATLEVEGTWTGGGDIVLKDSSVSILDVIGTWSSDNAISGTGLITGTGNPLVTFTNTGTVTATLHTLTLNTGQTVTNDGTLKAGQAAVFIVDDAVTGSGELIADGGALVLNSTTSGHAIITDSAVLDLKGAFSGDVSFVGDLAGTLKVETIGPVFDVIGYALGSSIDLTAITGSAFDGGQHTDALVRVVLDSSNKHALLQIDANGTQGGDTWATMMQLDGVHTGDGVNVIFSASQPAGTALFPLSDNGHFGDFDNDGMSDVVWRNDDGTVATWQMNGSTVTPHFLPGVPSDWHIMGTGDFNADGHADILWLNNDGTLLDWQMADSATLQTSFSIGTAPANSHLAGIGDVDHDGKSDLIWRDDASGAIAVNTIAGASNTISGIGNEWGVVGVADYNGDGAADIMFRNATLGINAAWLMNGTNVGSTVFYPGVPNDWHVEASGDFNGDGVADLFWHNDNGANAVWLMGNDGGIQEAGFFNGVGPDWHVIGSGDVNGDHIDDLLWSSDSGATAIWQMNGTAAPTVSFPGGVPAVWDSQAHHYDYV